MRQITYYRNDIYIHEENSYAYFGVLVSDLMTVKELMKALTIGGGYMRHPLIESGENRWSVYTSLGETARIYIDSDGSYSTSLLYPIGDKNIFDLELRFVYPLNMDTAKRNYDNPLGAKSALPDFLLRELFPVEGNQADRQRFQKLGIPDPSRERYRHTYPIDRDYYESLNKKK